MDSSVSPKDEIWFLRVWRHISNAVYKLLITCLLYRRRRLTHVNILYLEVLTDNQEDLWNMTSCSLVRLVEIFGRKVLLTKEIEHSFRILDFNPYPTAFPYGNGMVLHFYRQQESSTTKTVHKVINKRLKDYV